MIVAKNIGKRYGEKQVLAGIDTVIQKHAVTTLIGANGAGKSTLLSVISRLMSGEGEISIDGQAISSFKSSELAKKMSTLRQTNHVGVRLTVRELVSFGRYPHSQANLTKEDRKIVEQAIGYVEMDRYGDTFIDQLSGGERQRAFIAMIIAQDTEYILLDEPLNNLDMKHSVQIMRLLRSLVDEHGKTVVLVLHDINFAAAYSDYIISLKSGKLLKNGTAEEVITSEELKKVYDMDFTIHEVNGMRLCAYFK